MSEAFLVLEASKFWWKANVFKIFELFKRTVVDWIKAQASYKNKESKQVESNSFI